jgi:alpha-amylase/alpha-mannosidase (GH57 family)
MAQRYLTIHGHFYQPPRENPWTEAIERQDGAAPFHDWNDRINYECYTPNAYARVLDSSQRIVNIVNNFEHMSFNFGPTLLSWLEPFAPVTYQRILAADKRSVTRFGGHGSAIAQAYNHTIMPLSNEQDRRTQVLWGLADFRYRFQREPESMWMPETAVNEAVLRMLIDFGMKFLILSPYQAQRIRKIEEGEWIGVEHGEIDTTRPYRWWDRDAQGNVVGNRHLDIFFYHGDLSRGVGFEHLLRDSRNFANRVVAAFANDGTERPQLISVATDGESYGHHERHGERGLAYLLNIEAPLREFNVTNYGEYLSLHPPVWEVQLKEGPNGEGTAWSCAHGVGRWARDCGCRGDGPAHWTQEWRAPLRHALDELRDELNNLTTELGEPIFRDWLVARNQYIDVILKRTPERMEAFLAQQQRKALSREEKLAAIKLMEMQRNMQLMYTSCGWFFTEISGIETVQVIKYAARAIQLAEALSRRPFEGRFLQNLKLAHSNMPEYKDGEGVYEKLVKPAIVSYVNVVNTHAIRCLFLETPAREQLYYYSLQREDLAQGQTEHTRVQTGLVQVHSGVTDEQNTYGYALVKRSAADNVECHVRLVTTHWDYSRHRDDLLAKLPEIENELTPYLQKHWGGKELGLMSMFFDERQQVIKMMLQGRLNQIGEGYRKLYEENSGLIRSLRELGAKIPEELRVPARYSLSRELRKELEAVGDAGEFDSYRRCFEIVRTAARLGLEFDTQWASQFLQTRLEKSCDDLYHDFKPETCRLVLLLIEVSQRLKLDLRLDTIQNRVFAILQERVPPLIEEIVAKPEARDRYNLASDFLQVAYLFGFSIKPYKDRLQVIEQKLSEDPNLWP